MQHCCIIGVKPVQYELDNKLRTACRQGYLSGSAVAREEVRGITLPEKIAHIRGCTDPVHRENDIREAREMIAGVPESERAAAEQKLQAAIERREEGGETVIASRTPRRR